MVVEKISEGHFDRGGYRDGGNVGNLSLARELRQRAEFSQRIVAVSHAGVFMHVFHRGKHPQFVFHQRSTQGAGQVLAREGLLGIGLGIIQPVARIQGLLAEISRQITVPIVGAAPGGDDDRASVGARGIGVILRGAHHELLYGVRRVALQKAADEVVIVVAAIHREIHIQPRTAAERNSGDARLRRIRRLDRLGHRTQIRDVGKAAAGQRQRAQVFGSNHCLLDAAGGLNVLAGDRFGARLYLHGLRRRRRPQHNGYARHRTHGDRDRRTGRGKSGSCNFKLVLAGLQRFQAELPQPVAARALAQPRRCGSSRNLRAYNPRSAGIMNGAGKRAIRSLSKSVRGADQNQRCHESRKNENRTKPRP